MNIEGSFQHLVTDLFAFIATAIAGAIILATGFTRADGIASLLIAAIMLKAAYGLLKDSGRVLLEAAPEGMSVKEIGTAIGRHPHVESFHDLHVWEVSSGFPALSAHVLVPPGDDCHAIRRELEQMLDERFGIDHTTLQVDHSRSGNCSRSTARAATPHPARPSMLKLLAGALAKRLAQGRRIVDHSVSVNNRKKLIRQAFTALDVGDIAPFPKPCSIRTRSGSVPKRAKSTRRQPARTVLRSLICSTGTTQMADGSDSAG